MKYYGKNTKLFGMGQSWISVISMQLQHWQHCISHPWGVKAKRGELKMPFWTYVRTTLDRRSVKEPQEIKPSAVINFKISHDLYTNTFIIFSLNHLWVRNSHAEDNKLIKTGNDIFLLLTCQNFCRKITNCPLKFYVATQFKLGKTPSGMYCTHFSWAYLHFIENCFVLGSKYMLTWRFTVLKTFSPDNQFRKNPSKMLLPEVLDWLMFQSSMCSDSEKS